MREIDDSPADPDAHPSDRHAPVTETPDVPLEERVPPHIGWGSEARVQMTVRCHDCEEVPKVPDAGRVVTEPDGRRAQIMHNGVRVLADGYDGAWMTRLIELCRGHHEPQEERVFHEVVSRLPPDATMVELGGYWLYYTLWFLRDAPGRRALSVEPDPAHIALGRANAALNGREVEVVQGFVGGDHGTVQAFHTQSSGTLEIPCLAVPQLMAERGMERLDLLHCDVQGAELDVLRSCRALFEARRVDWVFVSTHHQIISGDPLTHQRCLDTLRRCGATIVAEHDVQESFSGDGLIVARFGELPADWPAALELSRNRAADSMFRNPLYDLAAAQAQLGEAEAQVANARAQVANARAQAAEASAERGVAEAARADADAARTAAETALAEAEADRALACAERDSLAAACDAARRELATAYASRSWRVTAPLRRLASLFRRAPGGEGGA